MFQTKFEGNVLAYQNAILKEASNLNEVLYLDKWMHLTQEDLRNALNAYLNDSSLVNKILNDPVIQVTNNTHQLVNFGGRLWINMTLNDFLISIQHVTEVTVEEVHEALVEDYNYYCVLCKKLNVKPKKFEYNGLINVLKWADAPKLFPYITAMEKYNNESTGGN